MADELRTRDLFEAGLAMERGLALRGLEVTPRRNGHHPTVTFLFEGKDARGVATEYREGKAEANVSALKHSIDYLRKRMWAAIDGRAGRAG